jgi:ankyrin repeat protein
LAAAKLLLSKGADPNQYTFRNENDFVFTPFLGAFFLGDTNMASLLLEHGADIETRNNRGNTALMHAAVFETPEPLQWLIARGANVNARGHHGHSALIYAAYNGRVENVRELLRAGADPFAKASNAEEPDTSFEYDAANEARVHGHDEILAMILEAQKHSRSKATGSR